MRSLTSELEFGSSLRVFLVAPHQTLIHSLVPATDGAYHKHQGSQQSDPRVLCGQYWYTVVQPLNALDRISLDRAVHRGGLAGINDLRMTTSESIYLSIHLAFARPAAARSYPRLSQARLPSPAPPVKGKK